MRPLACCAIVLSVPLAASCQAERTRTAAPATTSASAPSTSSVVARETDASADAKASDAQGPDGGTSPALQPRTWSGDDEANRITLALFDKFGVRSDLEREHWMDGGFRGRIHIVPTPPVGVDRKYLDWVYRAYEKMATWQASFREKEGTSPNYRMTPITLKFFVSEQRTTPSAYAIDWSIAFNLRGSLLQTETGVHETFVHETFHLNDQAHGDWSSRTMTELYRGIRNRCGTKSACFAPYSPGTTVVRGGTYYAFHADNDVREYAAELMVRFYKEADLAFRGASSPKSAKFKCGPVENARAWEGFVNEFFGGKDPVPGC